MNGNLATKKTCCSSTGTDKRRDCYRSECLNEFPSIAIARRDRIGGFMKEDHCQSYRKLSPKRGYITECCASLPPDKGGKNIAETFIDETGRAHLYYDDGRADRGRNFDHVHTRPFYASPDRAESSYRWLMPRMVHFPHTRLPVRLSAPVVGRNRQIDLVWRSNIGRDTRIINVQPSSNFRYDVPYKQPLPPWYGMTRAEYDRYISKRQSRNSSQVRNKKRPYKSRSSFSSFASYKSRFFKSCPSCFGISDSEESELSSSDEDDGGSDTENDDCEKANEDINLGDDENSNVSDQEDSSGGSDSEHSAEDSLDMDFSINSSIYDEDIMINEEKAFADAGQFESDEEFDFEDADGHAALSTDSYTDSDEFFRDSDDDRVNNYREVEGDIFDQSADIVEWDGMIYI